jgi:hypothetical protein
MKVFWPQCPPPPSGVGFVAAANIRGTCDIVWSCLTVVLLCTWAVQHPNVPIETTPHRTRQRIYRQIYLLMRRLWFFSVAFFAPELLTGKATMSLFSALQNRKQMEDLAENDQVEWTLSHSFLANMGGFAIEFENEATTALDTAETTIAPRETALTEQRAQPSRRSEGYSLGAKAIATPTDQLGGRYPSAGSGTSGPILLSRLSQTPRQLEDQGTEQGNTPLVKPASRGQSTDEKIDENTEELREKYASLLKSHSDKLGPFLPLPLSIIGETRWQRSDRNVALVEEALKSVRSSDLGHHSWEGYYQNIIVLRGNIWILDGCQLRFARQKGIIKKLPEVAEAQIKDKSKGDAIVKTLAIIQVLWLAIQLTLRKTEDLPATQLEIMTLAFAACSSVTYLLNWYKPQSVATRIYKVADKYPEAQDVAKLGCLGPTVIWFRRGIGSLGNDAVHYPDLKESLRPFIMASLMVAVLFGSVHLLAWNFQFPTTGEQLGWRIASILLIVIPTPVLILSMHVFGLERGYPGQSRRLAITVQSIIVIGLEVLYILARIFIFAEVTRSLFFLPSEAFVATELWNAPHLG